MGSVTMFAVVARNVLTNMTQYLDTTQTFQSVNIMCLIVQFTNTMLASLPGHTQYYRQWMGSWAGHGNTTLPVCMKVGEAWLTQHYQYV